MNRQISYKEIVASLKTGDLLLFHGIGHMSHLIEILEWSYWSHVGMVVLPKDIGLEGEEPLFFESTSSGDGIIDVLSGKVQESGVMLIPLKERIRVDLTNAFDNHFKVKYLSKQLTDLEHSMLKDIIHMEHGKAFPSATEVLKYYFDGKLKNVQMPGDHCFCSQLVARTLMGLKLISKEYVDNGYSPQDFNEFNNIPVLQSFVLTDGASLKAVD